MTPDELIATIEAAIAQYRTLPAPPPAPSVPPVATADDLHAALLRGGEIALQSGVRLDGRFVVSQSGTTLHGNGAHLHGERGPALALKLGVSTVGIFGLSLSATDGYSAVLRIGDVTNTNPTLTPRGISLERISVPRHRGQRAIECHGADVVMAHLEIDDVYSPSLADSQAVWIQNTPGPVTIRDSRLSAGSEIIMVGGDRMRLPDTIPSDITIENCVLWRPLAWKDDGINRSVKNCFELKTGQRVTVRNTVMDGCWKASQDGYAIVITPRSGGAIRDVVFDNVTVRNCAAGFNLTGHDIATALPTPFRTGRVEVINSAFRVSKAAAGGGRGILALLTMGPESFMCRKTVFVGDGSQLVLCGDSERVASLEIADCLATVGQYGIQGPTGAHLLNWGGWLDALAITGNTFTGASSTFQKQAPANTYVSREAFDALIAQRE